MFFPCSFEVFFQICLNILFLFLFFSLESVDMLCWLSSPVAEVKDRWLKCFVGVKVHLSGLEGPACLLSMTRKEAGCPLDCCCPLLATCLC